MIYTHALSLHGLTVDQKMWSPHIQSASCETPLLSSTCCTQQCVPVPPQLQADSVMPWMTKMDLLSLMRVNIDDNKCTGFTSHTKKWMSQNQTYQYLVCCYVDNQWHYYQLLSLPPVNCLHVHTITNISNSNCHHTLAH